MGQKKGALPRCPSPLSATPAFFATHELTHVLDYSYSLSDRNYEIGPYEYDEESKTIKLSATDSGSVHV